MTNDERKEILQLVAEGKMPIEEALELLEKSSPTVDNAAPTISTFTDKEDPFEKVEPEEKKTTGFEDIFGKAFNKDSNKKMDEFMNDIRGDLSQLSNRMMSIFSNTFSKVREFDMEFPFGEKQEITKSLAFNAEEVQGFDISIPNGKVTLTKGDELLVKVDVSAKLMKSSSEADANGDDFIEQFVRLAEGKLIFNTDSKLSYITVDIQLPDKQYDILFAKMLSGSIEVSAVDFKILKLKTYNGAIRAQSVVFDHANLNTGNGSIEVRNVVGADLEAETINGRIYVDGKIDEVDAESVNGHVVITTNSPKPHKVKAATVAGAVEVYVPKDVSLDGKVSSNFGKADVGLNDVKITNEEEQFLLKTVHFDKIIEGAPLLKVAAESRTGTVLVRYTIIK